MTIGEKLYLLRTKKNLSQSDVANQIGVSRQSVSKWENDESAPDFDKLAKISDFFEVTTDYLIKDAIENIEINSSDEQNTTSAYSDSTVTKRRQIIFPCLLILIGIITIGTLAVLSSIIPSYMNSTSEYHPFATSSIFTEGDSASESDTSHNAEEIGYVTKSIEVHYFLPFLSTYHLHWLLILACISIIYGTYRIIIVHKNQHLR
ncbi:MAG: helix-turn-helix domain-containing protein [Ruminococcus sp.]|nr:helix-turn-helix domain-containing protein [Ruminococcus sp.]MCM1391937.1 helix-turn-helix domain-containing protein [Ruminococcus sp.]